MGGFRIGFVIMMYEFRISLYSYLLRGLGSVELYYDWYTKWVGRTRMYDNGKHLNTFVY